MSDLVAVPTPSRLSTGRGMHRLAVAAIAAIGMLSAPGAHAAAQTGPAKRWDLTLPTGKVIPTGAQRGAIEKANLSALQISYVAHPAVAVVATVGWARSRDAASVDRPKLDVFTYDLGAEIRTPRWGEAVTLRTFAGLGAGARSYNYRSLPVDATHNLAAYGSVGGEVGWRRFGLRLEARDYVTGFEPLDGRGARATRNDVTVMAGLSFDWR